MRSKGEGEDDSDPESDDEDDEDQEGEDEEGGKRKRGRGAGRKKEGDKYMAPAEVQMHLKLLWETDTKLATLIWGRSSSLRSSSKKSRDGALNAWKAFFWRILPVAPSRFRPPSRSDDGSLAEHPQNHNLIKVCMYIK